MANMKNRNLKVIAQSGYQYQSVPAIRLCGKWLQSVGFNIGDFISVRCEDGRLIIEPDVERARMEEAEKAFMDRELKSLQKRKSFMLSLLQRMLPDTALRKGRCERWERSYW